MPTMTPEMTKTERLDALVSDAHAAISHDQASQPDADLRRELYNRAATYLWALADREEARAAFEKADEAYRAAAHPPHAHADDVNKARDLIARGVEMLALDTFDLRRDPAKIREASMIFAGLVEAAS